MLCALFIFLVFASGPIPAVWAADDHFPVRVGAWPFGGHIHEVLRIHRINQLAERKHNIGVSTCTRIRMDGPREYYIVNEYMIDYLAATQFINEFVIDNDDGYAAPHKDK